MSVVDFASYKEARERMIESLSTHNPRRKNGETRAWQFNELGGLRPKGHPEVIRRGPRGKILLETGQIWVEIHNGVLWRINRLDRRPDDKYIVTLGIYYHPQHTDRLLTETTLRQCMYIWDVVPQKNLELIKTLEEATRNGVGRLFGITTLEQAARLFGLDSRTGDRID